MRARTIREGSVGLLILLGIGLFGGLVLWLRGFNPTNRPYQLIAEFEDSMGVQVGTPVSYRGVAVGRVTSVTPRSNGVDIELEIEEKELKIPTQVRVETVESGLVGEVSIDITPLEKLPERAQTLSPFSKDCDSSLILCDGDRLIGTAGPSYEDVLRSAGEVADLFADPELINQLKDLLRTVSDTSESAGVLAEEVTLLTQIARDEIQPLSASAQTATGAATSAAREVEVAAAQFTTTATEINSLIGENRGILVSTLDNVQVASAQLRSAADTFGPTLQSGELVNNLETLVSNASAASADLQTITASLNTPANLVLLQQTLESARDALASAQKVMADLDELTGDPALRNQLRELINGLGDLVSSTQSLEQQSEVARALGDAHAQIQQRPVQQPIQKPVQQADEARETERAALKLGSQAGGEHSEAEPSQKEPVLVFDGERYILRSSTEKLTGNRSKP